MKTPFDCTNLLNKLRLTRVGDEAEAGLWITSLPWPRTKPRALFPEGRPTVCHPLGRWPRHNHPRRLLLVTDGANRAPQHLSLSESAPTQPRFATRPKVGMELFERSPHVEYVWERHLLRIRYGNRSIGIAMGLRTGGAVHWWEACRLIVSQETDSGLVVEMGGAIPRQQMTLDELKRYPGYSNPYLHKHNWLNGHLFVRIHANGVCEVYAHHVNSRFFDDGLPLEDVVPVIGFKTDASAGDVEGLCGSWDGKRERMDLGGVRLDVSEVSRLATPSQPGRVDVENGFLVWQPYRGVDVFGGVCPAQLLGDPFIYHAEKTVFPRGMARTLRFSLSLSDRSPRVVRYPAPAWWYGVCEEFLPAPLLPVSNEYDGSIDAVRAWIQESIVSAGFEDGSVPRATTPKNDSAEPKRHEPGWEGEIPYAQFLTAWRTGDPRDYTAAVRSAYHFTDVAVDHSAKLVRMHGYPFGAFALPMNRMQGTIAAYLETADPYLLEIAQAVTANAHWQHKNSWPRMAVGRDACYVRSAVLLYRYFGDEFYRRIAHEGAMTVAHTQRPNGSFGDQGGGAGIHQWGGYITKPWMGLLALNGVLDYLELFPYEAPLRQAVKKFADWLMAERWEQDGRKTWSYQHDFNGQRKYFDPFGAGWTDLPSKYRWHQENLARLLGYTSFAFGDPKYLDAWAESYECPGHNSHDHSASATLQFIPWIQAKLWNATPTAKGIQVRPVAFGPRTPNEARILSPDGPITVRWSKAGKVAAPKKVQIVRTKAAR